MTITVSRKYLRTLRSVFRKLASSRDMRQAFVRFTAGPDGLAVHCRAGEIAVEHRRPGAQPVAELSIPFTSLADLEGSKDEPLTFKPSDSGAVIAEWVEAGVPQQRRAVSPPTPNLARLEVPVSLTAVADGFAAAFVDASKSAADGPTRYALNCVALRGKTAQIAATDGKQLFIANGFGWPWDDDLLVPATEVLSVKELADAKFQIGRNADHVVLASADWTIWLPIEKDLRFPDIDHIVPAVSTAAMTVDLTLADAEFLAIALSRLPGKVEHGSPVTFHCNGHVAVRAQDQESGQITELVLSQSKSQGQELSIASNRDYLARAVAIGCHRLHAWNADKPVLATSPNRLLLWQPLSSEMRIKPTADAVQIQSPELVASTASTISASEPPKAKPATTSALSPINRIFKKERIAMQTATAPTNGHTDFAPTNRIASAETGHDVPSSSTGGPITQAEALKSSLRAALASVNDLLVSLKRQRKQSQLFKSTLASLKSLEKVA